MFGGHTQSDAEKQLTTLIYDENEHVISSLELNQLATFTYHEQSMATGGRMIHERMLDILEQVISRPREVTVLAMHKALVVLRHLLLYGAEKVIEPARTLGKAVFVIEEKYNTAVMAQEAAGATGFFNRLKGGAVDKGGPCREIARQINSLLCSPDALAFERNTKADPNALVPVGSRQRVGFITDEARLAILQRRMEKERQVVLKSNLAKSDSAFGSGYNSKDGGAVVGAAHSLEEMLKEAEKKEQAKARAFSDTPKASDLQQQQHPVDHLAPKPSAFQEYQAPDLMIMPQQQQQHQQQSYMTTPQMTGDLLSMGHNTTTSSTMMGGGGDLLDLHASPAPATATSDLLGTDFAVASQPSHAQHSDIYSSGGGGMTMGGGGATQMPNAMGTGLSTAPPSMQQQPKPPMSMSMAQGGQPHDRFAALDALNPMGNNPHNQNNNNMRRGDPSMMGQPQHPSFSASMPAQSFMTNGVGSSHRGGGGGGGGGLDSLASLSASLSATAMPAPAMGAPTMGAVPSTAAVGAMPTTMASTSSLRVSAAVGPGGNVPSHNVRHHTPVSEEFSENSEGGGFVMGGAAGSGLEPVGPAPAAPPPPPPPRI